MRMRQGTNHRIGAHQVGIGNVYKDDDGVVAQLALYEPATGREWMVRVRAGDEVVVGTQRFTAIPHLGEPGCVELIPNKEAGVQDSPNVAMVKDKVARYLVELTGTGYDVAPSGKLTARHGSTQIYIGCGPLGGGLTTVAFSAPILIGVAPTWELYRFIALEGTRYPFGRIRVEESEQPGLHNLWYEQYLVGDYLDREEFNVAISIVCQAADELDNEMQGMFGGSRMWEDQP